MPPRRRRSLRPSSPPVDSTAYHRLWPGRVRRRRDDAACRGQSPRMRPYSGSGLPSSICCAASSAMSCFRTMHNFSTSLLQSPPTSGVCLDRESPKDRHEGKFWIDRFLRDPPRTPTGRKVWLQGLLDAPRFHPNGIYQAARSVHSRFAPSTYVLQTWSPAITSSS